MKENKKKINKEIPVVFKCQQDELLGIIHSAKEEKAVGVLIVVGGSQYRVGAHRQFVLLARKLAEHGVSVMRFDQRSIGDASGAARGFDQIGEDIQVAIDTFMTKCSFLSGIVIWGLCDAASATLFYAYKDQRIKGLVLLNPWVYTEQGEAKAYLKYYYLRRIVSLSFWKKVFSFKFNYQQSISSLIYFFRKLFFNKNQLVSETDSNFSSVDPVALPERMSECLRQFSYPVLFILSGHDLTADQFRDTVKADSPWQQLMSEERVSQYELLEADHTFSSAVWRDQVAKWTLDWLLKNVPEI